MTEIKKEFAWLAVDAHGREIPEVETLFSRATSGGFGLATDRGIGRARKIGHASRPPAQPWHALPWRTESH